MTDQNVALMAHLMRRAGFGASRAELEELATQDYDSVVEALLNPESQPNIDEDLMMRDRPGVFCAGEMLDWDAPTGGYLITTCLASGRVAGRAAAAWAA